MIKLVAKRWEQAVDFEPAAGDVVHQVLPLSFQTEGLVKQGPDRIQNDQQARELLNALVEQIPRQGALHDLARPIAAAMVDQEGQLLGTSIHQAILNKTMHAEVVLIQKVFASHGRIPEGATIYCSLKPCRMCAGMALAVGVKQIRYLQEDPGPLARGSTLEKQGKLIHLSGRSIKDIS